MSLSLALFGYGTVGSAVYNILTNTQHHRWPYIKMVVVRNVENYKNTPAYRDKLLIDNLEQAIQRLDDVDIVVEVMGGFTNSFRVIRTALVAGKTVVTANKLLISKAMPELESLLEEGTSGRLFFEASVCGGIPIIKSMQRDIQGSHHAFGVSEISGIMNGTCNFILSEMERLRAPFGTVLKQAQTNGFAEADPSSDILGLDTLYKLNILTRLGFGQNVLRQIDDATYNCCVGIDQVHPVDFEYASMLRCKIKLLGTSKMVDGKLSFSVYPTLVPEEDPIAQTNGVRNIVTVQHAHMGTVSMSGPGAGGDPTAHSVVSDILESMRIVDNASSSLHWFGPVRQSCTLGTLKSRFYIRFTATDQLGITEDVGKVCKQCDINIHAMLQNPYTDASNIHFVVTTGLTYQANVDTLKAAMTEYDWCTRDPFVMLMK